MYSNIRSCVALNQEFSDYSVSYASVRLGENLSPLLFSLYVNNIEDFLLENNCKYVDINSDWINNMFKLLVIFRRHCHIC